jgi:hypothetical protein
MDVEIPKFRKMDINREVAVKLPVHVWLVFMHSYAETDWNNGAATVIAMTLRNHLLDPVYRNEQDAKYQEAQDQAAQMHQGILGHMGITPHSPDDPRMP